MQRDSESDMRERKIAMSVFFLFLIYAGAEFFAVLDRIQRRGAKYIHICILICRIFRQVTEHFTCAISPGKPKTVKIESSIEESLQMRRLSLFKEKLYFRKHVQEVNIRNYFKF